MTQKGFEDYLFAVYDPKNGTADSYITAIRIIDKLFKDNDVFALGGKSITSIDDYDLLVGIAEFIYKEQAHYKKGAKSFFDGVKSHQTSYPRNGFCSAAIRQLLKYHTYDVDETKAWNIFDGKRTGRKVSKELANLFKIDKEGKDAIVTTRIRLGQDYFRKMVLANYGCKCCVTGLNIPQTLRASHIVEWSKDKANRLNPENGLCLSATYDAAFDKHLISFDDDYCMIVSKEIKDYYTNDVAKEYFMKYEGKKIILPSLYLPSKALLDKHRELLVG